MLSYALLVNTALPLRSLTDSKDRLCRRDLADLLPKFVAMVISNCCSGDKCTTTEGDSGQEGLGFFREDLRAWQESHVVVY